LNRGTNEGAFTLKEGLGGGGGCTPSSA
jgi:hypothetical protein